MSNAPLSLEELRSQYDRYIQENPWPEWRSTYLAEVTRIQALSPEELASPKAQQQLWSLRGLSTLGPGESVNVQGAWTDPKVISAVVALRDTTWPQDPAERAAAIQGAYDALLALVHPAHARLKPQARLARLFAGLLPREQHCVFSWPAQRYTSTTMFGRMHRPIAAAVLARARLREALGPEKDLADDVSRSMFFWWMQPNEAESAVNDDPGKKIEATPTALDVIMATMPLALLPVQRQRRGLTAVNGYVTAFRAVVQAAQGGATPDDIVDTMRSSLGFADASPDHCRRIFNLVRPLRFLQHKDGLWYPSPDGERLLEEDPPDVLVERLLVETFGLGHLLQLLEERGPLTRKQRNQALRALYPAWTTDFAPSALGGWAYSLDLLDEREDGRQELTDYGRAWAGRLPKPLPIPTIDTPAKEQLEVVDGPDLPAAPVAEWPALAALLPAIRSAPATAGFVFDDADLRALHLAWHSHPHKRFVILSGLSGTGKTALLRHYAQIYCEQMGLDVEHHRAVVPVSPDWRDPSGLLGYFNALHGDPTYQAEPALRLVLTASKHPDRPYFLILDEMNLARVEHYFAPFLSAMETGDKLVLHAQDEPVNGVQPWIRWPSNLFIGGTINMDETTHAISDKVLDRAFTLEFWQVDLPTYFDRRAALGRARNAAAEAELLALHAALAPIRRHFGYRTASEILGLLDAAASAGLDSAASAQMLDQAIFSKVLPRIRGEDTPQLQQALAAIHDRCQAHAMPRCAAKIAEMQIRLRNTGLTRFWS